MKTFQLSSLFTLAALATSLPAHADVFCGSTPASWNAPNGAVVFSQNEGVVKEGLTTLGEFRTHTMISTGPGNWIIQADATAPQATPDCNVPLDVNELYQGWPGLEQVSQGAIYTDLYANSANNFLAYQEGANERMVSAYAWNLGYPYSYVWNSDGYYNIGWMNLATGRVDKTIRYAFNQLMDLQTAAQGFPGAYYQPAVAGYPDRGAYDGLVCSTAVAFFQHMGIGNGQLSNYSGDILPRTYPPAVITPAINAMYNRVHDMIAGKIPGSGGWKNLATLTGVGGCYSFASTVEDHGANQVVNCFTSNACGDTGGTWKNVVANRSAVSISPDDVGCWNRPANGSGAPCSGAGSSVWGPDGNHTVQWNGPGSSYGCWF